VAEKHASTSEKRETCGFARASHALATSIRGAHSGKRDSERRTVSAERYTFEGLDLFERRLRRVAREVAYVVV